MQELNINIILKAVVSHFTNRKNLPSLLLLGIWSMFQYNLGNKLYAISLVLVYIILTIPHFRSFTMIAAFTIIILIFKTQVIETAIEIKKLNLKTYQAFKPSLTTVFTPNSGQEVLPEPVERMLKLIETYSIPDYRLSPSLLQDVWIYQRVVEAAWPVKMEEKSHYLFILPTETTSYSMCTEIDQRKDIVLVNCP